MASIHRKLSLPFVFGDGDGGYVLKTTATDNGEHFDMALDVDHCLRLASELLNAARDLHKPKVSHETLKAQYGVKP